MCHRIRPFTTDDAPAATALLHRAYAELGAAGLNFTAVDQSVSTTLARATGGASWLQVDGAGDSERVLGMLTISLPPESALRALTPEASTDRAWINQLAVDPDARGQGLARVLRDHGMAWSRAMGASSIGLDTAQPASHLVALYEGWGFTTVDTVQWPGKTYRSVIMTRALSR